MAKTKSTAAEFQLRIKEVHGLLLSGRTASAIYEYGSKWAVSTRQIDDYIAGAKKIIQEINLASLEENQAVISNALWNEYRIADESKDRINILKELARIHGVGAVNMNVTVSEGRPLKNVTDEDLEAEYDQLKSEIN